MQYLQLQKALGMLFGWKENACCLSRVYEEDLWLAGIVRVGWHRPPQFVFSALFCIGDRREVVKLHEMRMTMILRVKRATASALWSSFVHGIGKGCAMRVELEVEVDAGWIWLNVYGTRVKFFLENSFMYLRSLHPPSLASGYFATARDPVAKVAVAMCTGNLAAYRRMGGPLKFRCGGLTLAHQTRKTMARAAISVTYLPLSILLVATTRKKKSLSHRRCARQPWHLPKLLLFWR